MNAKQERLIAALIDEQTHYECLSVGASVSGCHSEAAQFGGIARGLSLAIEISLKTK